MDCPLDSDANDSLGRGTAWVIFRPNDVAWEAQLARLAAYKAEHGHCNVPKGWTEDRLGAWVDSQRQRKRQLDRGELGLYDREPDEAMTAERAARLAALGFAWDPGRVKNNANDKGHPKDAEWEAQLARLAAYKAEHGDCKVPYGWAKDPRLSRWVSAQRARKRKLEQGEPSDGMTAERAARLTALGFAWDPGAKNNGNAKGHPKDAEWEAQLALLAAYKAEHGDCNVPHGWAEDPRLSRWVSVQRARKRKLAQGEPSEGMTAERAARLTALGLEWEGAKGRGPQDAGWEAQLARLAAYKAEHGDCNVPVSSRNSRLGAWINKQRVYKRKLDRGELGKPWGGMTAERAAQLTALGFTWDQKEAEWEVQLARLAAYKTEHGDCNVPEGWADDPPLSIWVNNQRALKRKLDRGEPSQGMKAARAAQMTALGFMWDLRATIDPNECAPK
jgi:hypothetical protein